MIEKNQENHLVFFFFNLHYFWEVSVFLFFSLKIKKLFFSLFPEFSVSWTHLRTAIYLRVWWVSSNRCRPMQKSEMKPLHRPNPFSITRDRIWMTSPSTWSTNPASKIKRKTQNCELFWVIERPSISPTFLCATAKQHFFHG